MSDFERKLAAQSFREPPAEWREEILRRSADAARATERAESPWRAWLWPSPQAWAGLAALWLIFFALQFAGHPSSSPAVFASMTSPDPGVPTPLLTLQNTRDFRHVLDLSN